jgi:hypothetical protein
MDSTTTRGPDRIPGTSRASYRRDDEEYETPPRWLSTRLHDNLVLSEVIDDRIRRGADRRPQGGQ